MDIFRRMKSRLPTTNLKKKKGGAVQDTDHNGHSRGGYGNSDALSNSNSSIRTGSYESTVSNGKGYSFSPASQLPVNVLTTIFGYVCPHSSDDGYECSEDSLAGNGCPLCSTRDLAQASQVCRKWRTVALGLLYRNIRLEQVHYCELEEELWRRRNRRSFFSNGSTDSNEQVKVRIKFLYRTIQENEQIANTVLYLKAPFWVREGCKQELTLLVSLIPNVRYIDLPQSVYTGDNSSPLLATMRSRSSQLRLMGWRAGGEHSLMHIASEQPWKMLEVISLSNLKLDDTQIQSVMASLPQLKSVTLEEMAYITDAIFDSSYESMGFPLIKSLKIQECPKLTIAGIKQYLLLQCTQPTLEELTLTNAGVIPDHLNSIMDIAPVLRVLSITCAVSKPCPPASQLRYLSSKSLRKITYDVTNCDSSQGLTACAPSYYQYLADSLCNGTVPSLTKLYVNEARFATRTKGTYTPRTRDGNGSDRGITNTTPYMTPNNSGFTEQKVDIYCKGHSEVTWKQYKWICQAVSAAGGGAQGSKMMTLIDMEPEKQWTSSRGFLTIPGAGDKEREQKEMSKKEKKRDKRKSLNDTYGMGAEYY
ncbi:hypothetical protein EV426DRAFT_7163 [Tirmania nivea]|nr:hypothetical protein EV426DRAFT_7163 [Tirmania nivea]